MCRRCSRLQKQIRYLYYFFAARANASCMNSRSSPVPGRLTFSKISLPKRLPWACQWRLKFGRPPAQHFEPININVGRLWTDLGDKSASNWTDVVTFVLNWSPKKHAAGVLVEAGIWTPTGTTVGVNFGPTLADFGPIWVTIRPQLD